MGEGVPRIRSRMLYIEFHVCLEIRNSFLLGDAGEVIYTNIFLGSC
jgi:hypothetical protein